MKRKLTITLGLSTLGMVLLAFLMACPTPLSPTVLGSGSVKNFTVDTVSFDMVSVQAGLTFPLGVDDQGDALLGLLNPPSSATIDYAYWIANTEITYELWNAVKTWATDPARGTNIYNFPAGSGQIDTGSSTNVPATELSWRDAIVWCNAATEWWNANNGDAEDYAFVYCTDAAFTAPLRSADRTPCGSLSDTTPNGSQDRPYVNPNARGFRLPSKNEWELAARYKDGSNYTPGNFASGASAYVYDYVSDFDNSDHSATSAVAVWQWNASGQASVKTKLPNALGLYDMSGNVWEWCFEWVPNDIGGSRSIRGGCSGNDGINIQIGNIASWAPEWYGMGTFAYGFRIAQTN